MNTSEITLKLTLFCQHREKKNRKYLLQSSEQKQGAHENRCGLLQAKTARQMESKAGVELYITAHYEPIGANSLQC